MNIEDLASFIRKLNDAQAAVLASIDSPLAAQRLQAAREALLAALKQINES